MSMIWTPDRQIIAPRRRVWTPPSRQRGFVFLPGGGLGAVSPPSGGGTEFTWVGSTGANSGFSASVTVNAPAGIAPGDLIVFTEYCNNEARPTTVFPSGVVQEFSSLTAPVGCRIFSLVAGSSEPTTYTFSTSLSAYRTLTCHVFRNWEVGVDVIGSISKVSAGVASAPSITSNGGALLAWFNNEVAGAATATSGESMPTAASALGTLSNTYVFIEIPNAAGSTGNKTVTWSASNNTSGMLFTVK